MQFNHANKKEKKRKENRNSKFSQVEPISLQISQKGTSVGTSETCCINCTRACVRARVHTQCLERMHQTNRSPVQKPRCKSLCTDANSHYLHHHHPCLPESMADCHPLRVSLVWPSWERLHLPCWHLQY